MKRIPALLLFGFISLLCTAQDNFIEGYIITNANDTTYGLIDFRSDKINSALCRFKENSTSDIKNFQPFAIKGYRLDNSGKYYVSHTIEVDKETRNVFLEYLVQGIMDLFYYNDGKQDYYYFENMDGTKNIITQKPERIENRQIIPDNKYKGTIRYLFRDYAPIAENTDRLAFNQKSMIGVAKKYHDNVCTTGEECIVFENKKPDDAGAQFQFSAYSGFQQSSYVFWLEDGRQKLEAKDIFPTLGIQLNLSSPRWSKPFSLQLDLSVSKIDEEIRRNSTRSLGYKADALSFSTKLGVKYTYQKYKIRPVIEAGFSYTNLFNVKGKIIYNGSNSTDYKMKQRFMGVYAGLGLDYNLKNNSSIFLRLPIDFYLNGDGTQHNGEDQLKIFSIKVGYTF